MTVVVALGGHLIAAEGASRLRATLAPLGDERLVVTHGNGPQVGEELLRSPETPIHAAVAKTQGEIGSMLAGELHGLAVVTHVLVAEGDPAFAEPTKPIGPVYEEEEARRLEHERGWSVAEDPGRGFRRVVASPTPREIVELDAVRTLVAAGTLVIACGGGGIPVVAREAGFEGVDAVIDKDRASALLGVALGARRLIVLTDADAVYRGFGTADAEPLPRLAAGEAEALLPELPAGSMRPKLEASVTFVRLTGREALITSAGSLAAALAGDGGTRVAA